MTLPKLLNVTMVTTGTAAIGKTIICTDFDPSFAERSCTRMSPAAALEPGLAPAQANEAVGAAAVAEAANTSHVVVLLFASHRTKRAIALLLTAELRAKRRPFNIDSAPARTC